MGAAVKVSIKKLEKQLLKEAHKAAKGVGKKMGKAKGRVRRHVGNYIPAPKDPQDIPAFPGSMEVRRKTSKGACKLRERWEDQKGNIYEWDSRHGTLEKYNKRGKHLGEFNKDTGEQLKPANPTRKIEP